MITTVERRNAADELCAELIADDFGPFFGTPCGMLAPLFAAAQDQGGLLTIAREDNAVGVAAGAAMAGRYPVVMMQNSGLGQSVNAIASLVVPYCLPILLIISMRGEHPDTTQENAVMGRLTRPLLEVLGIEAITLEPGAPSRTAVPRVTHTIRGLGRPAALLVSPTTFGWRP
jgi:sulfopyruvate decarboxylase subunit alpha/phosphonopyruvate decarboxylase